MQPQWTKCYIPSGSNFDGNSMPANLRKLGLENFRIDGNYTITIKSNIKTTYHFRDSDSSKNKVKDSNTNRYDDG